MAVDLIVAHVRGIYDPSVRHESIQLENFDNGQSLLSLSSAKKRNKKAAKKAAAPQQPSSTPSKRDVIPVVPTAKEALRKSKSSMADFHSTAPGSVVTAAAKKPAKASIVATEPEANVATGLVNGFKSKHMNGFANGNTEMPSIVSSSPSTAAATLNGHHSPPCSRSACPPRNGLGEVMNGVVVVGLNGENGGGGGVGNGVGGAGSGVSSPVSSPSATTSPQKILVASCQ